MGGVIGYFNQSTVTGKASIDLRIRMNSGDLLRFMNENFQRDSQGGKREADNDDN